VYGAAQRLLTTASIRRCCRCLLINSSARILSFRNCCGRMGARQRRRGSRRRVRRRAISTLYASYPSTAEAADSCGMEKTGGHCRCCASTVTDWKRAVCVRGPTPAAGACPHLFLFNLFGRTASATYLLPVTAYAYGALGPLAGPVACRCASSSVPSFSPHTTLHLPTYPLSLSLAILWAALAPAVLCRVGLGSCWFFAICAARRVRALPALGRAKLLTLP